jgi:hypothetical protein
MFNLKDSINLNNNYDHVEFLANFNIFFTAIQVFFK